MLEFISSTPLTELYVSVVSLAEIQYGMELSPESEKRAALQDWLTLKVRPMFAPDRTLQVTEETLLSGACSWRTDGKPAIRFSQPDLLIAASAAHYGLTVISRDRFHFERAGVPVVNPWEAG